MQCSLAQRIVMFVLFGCLFNSNCLAFEDNSAAVRAKGSKKDPQAKIENIDLFSAMDDGLVEVNFIGLSYREANVFFKNKTDKPIHLNLPRTFGAVPVLAQGFGGGQGGGLGGGGLGGGGLGGGGLAGGGLGGLGGGGLGGGQGVGGGFGGGGVGGGAGGLGGGGLGGGGGAGGFFRVEPDKPRKLSVSTVCLEHGKPDPNPRKKYKLVRLEEVNAAPEIALICAALGDRQIGQSIAQAAAWHIANGLTWHELAWKPRIVSQYTGTEYYFSTSEIQAAMVVASRASSGRNQRSISDSTSYHHDSPQK